MGIIVDGRRIYEEIVEKIREEVSKIKEEITLGVIAQGNDAEMKLYIKNKRLTAQNCGIRVKEVYLPEEAKEKELVKEIEKMNEDEKITGFIVQLPIKYKKALNRISPLKDVDCLTPENLGRVFQGIENARFIPCATLAMIEVIKRYEVGVAGKYAVVIGASDLVGKPCAVTLLNLGATVSICHKLTPDISKYVKEADILVSSTGVPGIIKAEWIKKDAVVIDIGTKVVNGKVTGDVEEGAREKAKIITPVPGGIGIITVAKLMENTLKAYKIKNNKN